MKLQVLAASDLNTVTAYGEGYIEVNRVRHAGAVLLAARGDPRPWAVGADVEALERADFAAVEALQPELLIVGTGARHAFLAPALRAWLAGRGLPHETMDTPAACRTFNLLAAEGRQVVGALLPFHPHGAPHE